MADGPLTRDRRRAMDERDELAFLREAFALPAGRRLPRRQLARRAAARARPRAARGRGARVGRGLIRSWNEPAGSTCRRASAARIAPLVGAAADEVAVADSTSVNLFKLLAGAPAAAARPARDPVRGGELPHRPLRRAGPRGAARGRRAAARAARGARGARSTSDVAVLMLTQVDFRTGELHDMAAWTRGRARGGRARALGPRAQRRARCPWTSTAAAPTSRSAAATST